MKTQIHYKQIIVLVLSMVMSIMSYWILLPPEPQAPIPSLPEAAAAQSAPTDRAPSDREPATAGRFPVTARIPQTINRSDDTVTQPDNSAKSIKRLIDLPELSNGERDRLNNSKFMPITDQDRNLKH